MLILIKLGTPNTDAHNFRVPSSTRNYHAQDKFHNKTIGRVYLGEVATGFCCRSRLRYLITNWHSSQSIKTFVSLGLKNVGGLKTEQPLCSPPQNR